MLKTLLVLAVAVASLAHPRVDATPAGGKQRDPARDGSRWRRAQNSSDWPNHLSSHNFFFPSPEVQEYINSQRGDRPGDAIVFPGNAETSPVFGTDFGYGRDDGPQTWAQNFPICAGRRQSPVNINLNIARNLPDDADADLDFENYDVPPSHMIVTNSGHSLRLSGNWTVNRSPTVSGYPLPGEYTLAEVHFHWGGDDQEGSEHVVQGRRFPLEMHVVHYKTAYGSFNEATTKNDGLAVISYLFKIHRKANHGLQKVLAAVKDVISPKLAGASIEPFELDKLVPPFSAHYATYLGSLTTPPCSEIVTWIVNLEPLHVSSEQIAVLRGLKRSEGRRMLFNFRPIQTLHGREIINVP